MKKPIQTLIAGITVFAILSAPLYAKSNCIKKDISDLESTLQKICGSELYSRTFEGKKYDYKVNITVGDRLKLGVYDKSANELYEFIDEECDSTLDLYTGSIGYDFTPETTDAGKWKELQDNYHRFVREVLHLAKKVLKEKNSSLDEDLEDMRNKS